MNPHPLPLRRAREAREPAPAAPAPATPLDAMSRAEPLAAPGPAVCRDVRAPEFAEALSAFLAARSLIPPSALDRAQRAARATGERFHHVLTKLGLLSEADLAQALSDYLAIPIVAPAQIPAAPILTELLEPDFVRRNKVMPLAAEDGALVVGVTDPFDDEPMRALSFLADRRVDMRIFAPAEFDKTFNALYAQADAAAERRPAAGGDASEVDVQRLRDHRQRGARHPPGQPDHRRRGRDRARPTSTSSRPSSRFSSATGSTAFADGADAAARRCAPPITSRIKIMAKLDIAERRMPQDGRIKIAVRGVDIDFRVSTIPTAYGESVVHAHSRPLAGRARLRASSASTRRRSPHFGDLIGAAERHHPGHRPDRQRQDDHALYGA